MRRAHRWLAYMGSSELSDGVQEYVLLRVLFLAKG